MSTRLAENTGRKKSPFWHHPTSLTPTTRVPCSNAAKTRNPLKLATGCRKQPNRSQPLVGRSSPYCKDTWRTYCCLTSFFMVADTCLGCEDIARQSSAMVCRWRIFGDFFASCIFQRAMCSTFQTCILNSH